MKAKSVEQRRRLHKAPDETAPPAVLSDEEKRAWLRLIRTPHIGGVTFWELLSHFGSASAALEALPEFAKHGSRVAARGIPASSAVEAELERATAAGMTLHAAGEPGYPPFLVHVEAPPPLIYTMGTSAVWERPPVAVVGSRVASAAGLKFAAQICAELASEGYLIVSGLARGIDAAAHRASLHFGTCAVLPGGLDMIYPPQHSDLAEEIAHNGLLISECPPGFAARSQDFPRRNRIISGCSLGVVVVEAAEKSGSLITARLAGEQNREVFAVPGHPFEPRAAGTNRLIREGAIITTGAADIQDALRPLLAAWRMEMSHKNAGTSKTAEQMPKSALPPIGPIPEALSRSISPSIDNLDFLDETTSKLLPLLSFSPVDVDDLCRLSGLETRHVHAALLSLDLAGRIERRGLRQVFLRP